VRCVDEPWPLGGLALCHHPQSVPGAYALAGHLHPAVVLGGRAHERLRLPCFHFGAAVGVLPAFGAFTGMHVVERRPGERVYVVAGDEVRALPGA
jgi:metallophosphoesterase superfamily enzyme